MCQSEIQGEEMTVEIHPGQLRQFVSRLLVIFYEQVLGSQYFSQIKPHPATATYLKQIFYRRGLYFFDPDLVLKKEKQASPVGERRERIS